MARKSTKFPASVYVTVYADEKGVEWLEAARKIEDIEVDRGARIVVGVYEFKGAMTVRNQTSVGGKPLADKDVPRGA